jgi:hypothetical protein
MVEGQVTGVKEGRASQSNDEGQTGFESHTRVAESRLRASPTFKKTKETTEATMDVRTV